jgi:hypothetical protein
MFNEKQSPAHHPVDRRDRTLLDDLDQCPALRIVQPRTGPGGLAVQQPIGAPSIESDHPVPHNLKPDAADPSRVATLLAAPTGCDLARELQGKIARSRDQLYSYEVGRLFLGVGFGEDCAYGCP